MSAKLGAALIAAQKDMPAVAKTGRSNFGAHVTLDHLISVTRPHLASHGLAITQFIDHTDLGQPALRTTLMHESGESLSSVMPLLLTQPNMQQLGSATTYARRYAWAAALGISSETDDDGDSVSLPERAATGGQGERPAAAVEQRGAAPAAATNGAAILAGDAVCPLGKNKGKTAREMTRNQLKWYAEDEFQPTMPDGVLFKQAAQAFLADNNAVLPAEEDVPF